MRNKNVWILTSLFAATLSVGCDSSPTRPSTTIGPTKNCDKSDYEPSSSIAGIFIYITNRSDGCTNTYTAVLFEETNNGYKFLQARDLSGTRALTYNRSGIIKFDYPGCGIKWHWYLFPIITVEKVGVNGENVHPKDSKYRAVAHLLSQTLPCS